LFACGHVWHSLDAGQSWTQIPSVGLPLWLRDGRIAMDRAPGRLYLAVILAVPSNLQCLLCPFTEVQPAIYLSSDGGHAWKPAAHFSAGPSGVTNFRTITPDPDYGNAAWAILVTGERVEYFATNTGGAVWHLTCEERLGFNCDPPSEFLAAHHNRQN